MIVATRTVTPHRHRLQIAAIAARTGDALLKAGIIDELQLLSALSQQDKFGGRLARVVTEMGFAQEFAVVDALAGAFGVERAQFGLLSRDSVALSKLDPEFCRINAVFPMAVRDSGKTLCVAMAEPCDLELVDTVASLSGCRVKEFVAGEREILAAIGRFYGRVEHSQVPSIVMSSEGSDEAGSETPSASYGEEESSLVRPRPAKSPSPAASATPAELIRQLQQVQAQLEKATRVLRALVDVGEAKGLFTTDEIRTASKRVDNP